MTEVSIEEVRSRTQLDSFITFPWQVYRDSRHWVPPLISQVRHDLDMKRHPFWRHADGALFLARQNGRLVGRISAQIDWNYVHHWHEQVGSFGFFECVNDTACAHALIDTGAAWLAARGMERMRGPLNPSINAECAWLTEGFDRTPSLMMSYNPPYYPAFAHECGLAVAKDLLVYEQRNETPTSPAIYRVADRLRRNPRLRVCRLGRLVGARHVSMLTSLFNDCWARNWGFSPLTEAEMDEIVWFVKLIGVKDLALIAWYDGEPAGISITVPDVNHIVRGFNGTLGVGNMLRFFMARRSIPSCRTLILGVRERYRGLGIPFLFYVESEPYVRAHFSRFEFSWILEDNVRMNAAAHLMGASVCARYRLYERVL